LVSNFDEAPMSTPNEMLPPKRAAILQKLLIGRLIDFPARPIDMPSKSWWTQRAKTRLGELDEETGRPMAERAC